MALTLSVPKLGAKGKPNKAWRLALVSLALAFPLAVIVAWFMFVPFVNNAVTEALRQGGTVFVMAVIVPSGFFTLITLIWGARILWRVSAGNHAQTDKAEIAETQS